MATNNEASFWALSVTVVSGKLHQSQDYWSESDCYVTLSLPKASTRTYKTEIVANSHSPVWNETFNFRVQSNLNNILEFKMFDSDPLKRDDLISTLQFDISKLTLGKKETKVFITNPETKDELTVEFDLQKIEISTQDILSMDNIVKKPVSFWTLTVTVLRAEIHQSFDYLSKADCYVSLNLPTASAKTYQTKAVHNSQKPVWNETFTFRVYSHVKNVLEIRLYDDDNLKRDDLMSTLLFDISNLIPGKKEAKVFITNPETNGQLFLDFKLQKSTEPTKEYITNGVLVAAPFSAVDVNVDKLRSHEKVKNMALKLRGAFQKYTESQNPQATRNLRFYVNRDLETEVGLADSDVQTDDVTTNKVILLSAVPLRSLPSKQEVKVSLSVGQDTLDLDLQANDGVEENFEVRLDFDIPPQEKQFLEKRKAVVGPALQKLLGLSAPLDPKKLPTIALVGSGGGTRAMTGLFGSLRGLQQLGILDAVTYITGVSGSTWAMSSLYQDDNWSEQNLDAAISAMEGVIDKTFTSAFTTEKLQYYNTEMQKKGARGYNVSLIDMWGLVIEYLIFGKENPRTLSEQQKSVAEGQNPLPIYTAVNMKDGLKGGVPETEWCEFTPYEVGIAKYGAFVRTEDFGSQFFLGHMIKKLPEDRLAYLIGMWSSVFSINLTQMWQLATGATPSWTPWLGPDVSNLEIDTDTSTESAADTYLLNPLTEAATAMTGFLKDRPVISKMYNFMRGFFLHWDYDMNNNFNAWKDTHPDAFPNHLTPTDSTLQLVDAGHAINIGCAPVVRLERNVDLIISLSYSWDPNIFNVLQKTATYCKDHKMPFPRIDFAKLAAEPKKEFYVFEDKENPKAPIVIHFALVNVTYKEFKYPGVPRKGEEEIKAGNVDVSSDQSPYKTSNLTYTKDVFRALVDICTYNILNNKEKTLEVIRRALERKA